MAKAKAKAKAFAKALAKAPAARKKVAGAAQLSQLDKIKRELPERVKRLRETNLLRSQFMEANNKQRYAAELDRLRGESGLLTGTMNQDLSARMDTLRGALNMNPSSGTAFYPQGLPPMI
jgi:hypothetical protein